MAVIIVPEIRGQECSDLITYSYLFEPLRINVTESNPLATKLFVEVERYNIENKTVVVPFEDGSLSLKKYVEIDLAPNTPITFDLSEVMVQLHKANVYKIATIADIETSYEETVISKFIYSFKFTSDVTLVPTLVKKLPILGGRNFGQFNSLVSETQVLTDFEYYSLDINEISKRWSNFTFFKSQLKSINSENNLQPIISRIINPEIETGGAGVLYWKSRFGGWMFWGFDIEERNTSNSYEGELEVSMFESTRRQNGDPYIPINYMSVSSSYSITLKTLGVRSKELLALSGISSSTAIYYASDNSGKLELMRLSSSSSPYNNLANGGDFSVSLKSISKTSQKTS